SEAGAAFPPASRTEKCLARPRWQARLRRPTRVVGDPACCRTFQEALLCRTRRSSDSPPGRCFWLIGWALPWVFSISSRERAFARRYQVAERAFACRYQVAERAF